MAPADRLRRRVRQPLERVPEGPPRKTGGGLHAQWDHSQRTPWIMVAVPTFPDLTLAVSPELRFVLGPGCCGRARPVGRGGGGAAAAAADRRLHRRGHGDRAVHAGLRGRRPEEISRARGPRRRAAAVRPRCRVLPPRACGGSGGSPSGGHRAGRDHRRRRHARGDPAGAEPARGRSSWEAGRRDQLDARRAQAARRSTASSTACTGAWRSAGSSSRTSSRSC